MHKGFILLATLWFLATLTVAASFFALWVQRTLETAQYLREDVQGELDMSNTQAILLYLLTTQRFTIGGLTVPLSPEDKGSSEKEFPEKLKKSAILAYAEDSAKGTEIMFNDQPYFGQGQAYFALQDLGGLINLNTVSEIVLNRLLGILGVEPHLRAPLMAKLYDYIDPDDLHRINGAESYHYKQRHLPPPSNRLLTNPLECKRVMEWAQQTSLWKDNALAQLTMTMIPIYPNFNTAPAQVLQAAYDLTPEGTKRIIELRKTMPFYNVDTLSQVAGQILDIDPVFEANFYAVPFLRMTLWHRGGHRMRQIHLKLTPQGNKPWLMISSLELKLLPTYIETLPDHAQTPIFVSTLPPTTH